MSMHSMMYNQGDPDRCITPLISGRCPTMFNSSIGRLADHVTGIHIADPGYLYTGGSGGSVYGCVPAAAAAAMENGVEGGVKLEADVLVGAVGPGAADYGALASLPTDGPAGRLRKNKEDKLCGVCGDRALGYNFDAISCESCKAFFRRNAPKGLDYFKCPYDEKCKMDISNRRFCKRCRLKKCFEIGMRKEYILTEEEKARKKQKIEENRVIRDVEKVVALGPPTSVTSEVSSQSPGINLETDDSRLIEELHSAYKASLEVTAEKLPSREDAGNMSDLVNIAELSVRRVIDMAKKVSSFKALPQADQISLLKGGSIELLILRSVITFDTEKQHFLEGSDQTGTHAMNVDQLRQAERGLGLFDEHMKFVRSLAVDLAADETTLIILLIISLFSPDRPNLLNKQLVSAEQERYSILLLRYLEARYSVEAARNLYPKLLMKLTDIRNLNEEHSQVLLKVNPEGIQPLMQEVLDIRDAPGDDEEGVEGQIKAGTASPPPLPPDITPHGGGYPM